MSKGLELSDTWHRQENNSQETQQRVKDGRFLLEQGEGRRRARGRDRKAQEARQE